MKILANNANTTQPRRIGYARVSTKRQDLTVQEKALYKAGCTVIYADHGVSGRITRRKGLSAALSALRPNDIFVVQRIDRLGRDMQHLARIMALLERKDVELLSLSQNVDINTASGKLVFHIFSAFAEFESNLNGERTRGGLQVRRQSGKKLGRKSKLSMKAVDTALRMLDSGGNPVSAVASVLGVSESTLRRAIKKRRESEAA